MRGRERERERPVIARLAIKRIRRSMAVVLEDEEKIGIMKGESSLIWSMHISTIWMLYIKTL